MRESFQPKLVNCSYQILFLFVHYQFKMAFKNKTGISIQNNRSKLQSRMEFNTIIFWKLILFICLFKENMTKSIVTNTHNGTQ